MEHQSTQSPQNGQRIWWRDFKGTPAFIRMKQTLHRAGFQIVVVFDEEKVAKDVYIEPRHNSTASSPS